MTNMLNQKKLVFFVFTWALLALGSNLFATPVYLDGELNEVYFNDGDTFRVTEGPMKGVRARLTGFNALEAYGPVHSWGDWNNRDLHKVASQATTVAQNGEWHCKSLGDKDRYGRQLYFCDDLLATLIGQGLAHVMLMVPANTREAVLLRMQDRAIKGKKGIWAKGAPSFILTSVHSKSEPGGSANTYDRFVSTVNGESIMVNHKKSYNECEIVCSWPDTLEPLPELLRRGQDIASCMTYVAFHKRYGNNRPQCLK